MDMQDFVRDVGPTLRSIYPSTFKKSDPEAAEMAYAVWHHALKSFEAEQIKLSLIGWQATHRIAPKPRDIKEGLTPNTDQLDDDSHDEDMAQHEQEKVAMEQGLSGFDEVEMQSKKAQILRKNPALRWLIDVPATSMGWKKIIYADMRGWTTDCMRKVEA